MTKDKTLQLRKQVHKLFGDNQVYDDGYQSCYDGKWIDMTDEVCAVADFITADRKRVALEAELKLLSYLLDEYAERMFMQTPYTGEMTGNCRWACNTALTAVDAHRIEIERRKRIAELRAQQEEA